MTRMTPLLGRNEQFARTYTPAALGLPTAQVIVVACLDHRVDPAIALGLQLGDAPVIRNAGGRVTQAVIDDIAFLAFLVEQLSGTQGAADTLFEVAVVHHTQCGTGTGMDGTYLWSQQKLTATLEGRHFDYDHFTELDHNEYLAHVALDWKLTSLLDGILDARQEQYWRRSCSATARNCRSTSTARSTPRRT